MVVGVNIVVYWTVLCVLVTRGQVVFENPNDATEEDEVCNRVNNKEWLCKKDRDCPSFKAVLKNGGRLKTCSWKDSSTHIVCCPPDIQPQSISERKCSEYQALLCQGMKYRGPPNSDGALFRAGPKKNKTLLARRKRQSIRRGGSVPLAIGGKKAKPREYPHMAEVAIPKLPDDEEKGFVHIAVIGGENAMAKEHPHMALIGYGSEGSITWQCGGSLISESFVLSAAHCSDTGYGPARWVRLGDLDIRSDTDDARPQQFRIVERFVHRGYREPAFYNDIVLFKLDRSVLLDKYVGPACLHTNRADPKGMGIATGWGKNETSGPRSSSLVKVNIGFVPTEECKRKIGIIKGVLPKGLDSRTMLCAGDPGKDTCQGDSGGPLILANRAGNCLARQVGVTSFGPKNCGRDRVTGTYVRVATFIPWIESIVWPNTA